MPMPRRVVALRSRSGLDSAPCRSRSVARQLGLPAPVLDSTGVATLDLAAVDQVRLTVRG